MKRNFMKKVISSIAFVFAFMMLAGWSVEPVQAAVSFTRSNINISQGDEVYLPYLLNTNAEIEYLWDEENLDNPAVYFLMSDAEDINEKMIMGNRTGSVNIYAVNVNNENEYDSLNVSVYPMESLSLNTTKRVDFFAGLVSRSFMVQVGQSAVFRFVSKGSVPSGIYVFDENGNEAGRVCNLVPSGGSYVSAVDMVLEGGHTYQVGLATYTSAYPFDAPNSNLSLDLTFGHVTYATGINMSVSAPDALKVVGDTYYVLPGTALRAASAFAGGPYLVAETYDYSTSNGSAVTCAKQADGSCAINSVGAGTAEITVTSSNGLKDTITVKVVNEADLIPGDVDFDGELTRNDMLEVLSVMKNQVSKQKIHDYADINKDGQLNEDDIEIMMKLAGMTDGLPFVDVSSDEWFYSVVESAYNEGLMTGLNKVEFDPYGSLVRAQFTSILYRMNDKPEVVFTPEFTDIFENDWYMAPILWAKSQKVVNGYSDDSFGPDHAILREQIAIMMHNYAISKGYDVDAYNDLSSFEDAYEVSSWARPAVQWAVGAGIINGKANGTILDPLGYTSRAECAAIVMNFLEIFGQE